MDGDHVDSYRSGFQTPPSYYGNHPYTTSSGEQNSEPRDDLRQQRHAPPIHGPEPFQDGRTYVQSAYYAPLTYSTTPTSPHASAATLPAETRQYLSSTPSYQRSQRPLVQRPRRSSQGTSPAPYTASAHVFSEDDCVPESAAALYASFRVRPKKFFRRGKVFTALWSEPAGNAGGSDVSSYSNMTGISSGCYGEQVFSKIRRFVVIREGGDSCAALPISTYTLQGVAKTGVRKEEHAIIYTGKTPPAQQPGEAPSRGNPGLLPQAIRVDMDAPDQKLDILSRINFGKVYTIEHNVKVQSVGSVNRDSESALFKQFDLVWSKTTRQHADPASPSTAERLPSVPETPEGPSIPEWIHAFGILRENGFSENQAEVVLRNNSVIELAKAANSKPSVPPTHIWTEAFAVLTQKGGLSENRARSVLRDDPRDFSERSPSAATPLKTRHGDDRIPPSTGLYLNLCDSSKAAKDEVQASRRDSAALSPTSTEHTY